MKNELVKSIAVKLAWLALRLFTVMCWFLVLQVTILGEGSTPYLQVALLATALWIGVFVTRKVRAARKGPRKTHGSVAGIAAVILVAAPFSACDRSGDYEATYQRYEKIFLPAEFELPESFFGDPRQGLRVFFNMEHQACIVCHPMNGRGWPNAPDLGRFGTTAMEKGMSPKEFRESVIESLMNPDAELAEGFPSGIMPSYEEVIGEQEIEDLLAFLWLQRGEGDREPPPASGPAPESDPGAG